MIYCLLPTSVEEGFLVEDCSNVFVKRYLKRVSIMINVHLEFSFMNIDPSTGVFHFFLKSLNAVFPLG